MIHYQLNQKTFILGDTLICHCHWQPSGKEAPKMAVLTFGWRTEGRGDIDRHVLYQAMLKPQATINFSCRIPDDAPPSYDGELLRIIWEVRVDLPSQGLIGSLGLSKIPQVERVRVTSPANPYPVKLP